MSLSARRIIPGLGLFVLMTVVAVWALWPTGGKVTINDRASDLAAELRCPDCEGLNVADSTTTSARSIRKDLLRRLKAGEDEAEIKNSYANRYGESILLNPDGGGLGILVWGLPVLLLVLGGVGITIAIMSRSRSTRLTPTESDREEVKKARGK